MSRKSQIALMPKTETALSALDSMWAAVDAALGEKDVLTERPANSFTADELAVHRGMGIKAVEILCAREAKRGRFKRWRVRMPDARGHVIVKNVFTLVNP